MKWESKKTEWHNFPPKNMGSEIFDFLIRWAKNLWCMVWGSILWLFGAGGFEMGMECTGCGSRVRNDETAMDYHRTVCPAGDGE